MVRGHSHATYRTYPLPRLPRPLYRQRHIVRKGSLMEPTKAVWLKRYVIPPEKHEGWAIIHIDANGFFATVSDYGNYAYLWTSFGPNDFRKFLAQLDQGYVVGKLTGGKTIYDGEATLKAIKEHIIGARKEGTYSRGEARHEWGKMVYNREMLSDVREFEEWCDETKIEEPWEFHCSEPEPQAVAFYQKVWPRFVELIKAELEWP